MWLPSGALLIGAERVAACTGGVGQQVNPATGVPQAEFSLAGPDEIALAVATASSAFARWRAFQPDARRQLLGRFAESIIEHADDLALIGSLEGGIPITVSRFMALRAASYLDYYAGWADKIEGSVVPVFPNRGLDYVLPEPYGVVAALTSWNGHSGVLQKTAAALAAGNCVIIKPSELSPFAALRYGEIALEAGLPPGVFNVVPGGSDAGRALVEHPGVGKVTLTGGRTTAQRVMASAAPTLKPLLLELGGKSPSLVFEDTDIESAVAGSIRAALALTGQGCVNPTRLLVQQSSYESAVSYAEKVVESLNVGDPLDPRTELGPVITESAMQRILGVVETACSDGDGRLVTGGRRIAGELADGWFVEPTLIADVDNDSFIARNEIFGPVVCMTPFTDEAEAVTLANDTDYGLAGYVYTNDLDRAHRVAAKLSAAYISVNAAAGVSVSTPFGGQKQSGFGREGGQAGLWEFLHTKNVYVAERGA